MALYRVRASLALANSNGGRGTRAPNGVPGFIPIQTMYEASMWSSVEVGRELPDEA